MINYDRISKKLAILADAAKYDVSCSSSGGNRKNSGGLGDSSKSGICHSYTEDGWFLMKSVILAFIMINRHGSWLRWLMWMRSFWHNPKSTMTKWRCAISICGRLILSMLPSLSVRILGTISSRCPSDTGAISPKNKPSDRSSMTVIKSDFPKVWLWCTMGKIFQHL